MDEDAQEFTAGIYVFWRRYKSGRGGEKKKKVMTGSVEKTGVFQMTPKFMPVEMLVKL